MNRLKLVFMGSPALAVPCLQAVVAAGHRLAAVVAQPDRRAGRGKKVHRCPAAAQADRMGAPLLQPERVGDIAAELRALEADAACVLAYGQLLPPPVLAAFPLGCINLHTSLLPELRGAAPINWAIVRGCSETGVTTMFMDQGLDSGDIIHQEATPIGPQDTAETLADRLAQMGARLMVRTLEDLARGRAPRRPQDHGRATQAPKLKKTDGLVDWRRPAEEIDRLVRGMDPWPSAFTSIQGGGLRLFAPTRVLAETSGAQPGELIPPPKGHEDMMWTAAGRGALGLGQVQAAGKRRMAAAEFLRGARLGPGTRLGDS